MWEDILEALAVGGSGAISGYQQAKELEAARAERERERQEAQAFRDAQLAMQRERLEMERAAGKAREDRATEQDLASGMLREAREIPNLAAARSTISEALKAGERADEGLFGVTPAPGQTYAPQAMRNYRAMAEAAGRPSTREPTEAMMAGDISPLAKSLMEETAGEGREVQRPGAEGAFLSDLLAEVPEFTPSDTFQERGSREFEGRILRPTTPAERAATEAEFKETFAARDRDLLARALAGDEEAQIEAFSRDLGDELENLRSFREPEVEDLEEPEKLRLFRSLRGELGDEAAYRAAFGEELGGGPSGGGRGGRGGGEEGGMDAATIRAIMSEANDIISKGKVLRDPEYETEVIVPYTQEEINDIIAQQLELYRVVSGEENLPPVRETVYDSPTRGLFEPRPQVTVPLLPGVAPIQGVGGAQSHPMSEADLFLMMYGGGQ